MSDDMEWYGRRMEQLHRELDASRRVIDGARALLGDAAGRGIIIAGKDCGIVPTERLTDLTRLLADYDERRVDRKDGS